MNADLLKVFYEAKNKQHETCLIEGCGNSPINSHTVQNSKILDLLCHNDHVIQIVLKTEGANKPRYIFDRVGRNKASTFRGLCQKHDNDIFTKIDNNPFNENDDFYLLLLSYRALLKEYSDKLSVCKMIEHVEKETEKAEKPPSEEMTAFKLNVIHAMNQVVDHLKIYEQSLKSGVINGLAFFIFKIDNQSPAISASSVVNANNDGNGKLTNAAINILPVSNDQSVMLVACKTSHKNKVRKWFSDIKVGSIEKKKNIISKILIQNCENIQISPTVFDAWSEQKRERILAFFSINLDINKIDSTDEALSLF